MVFVNAEPVLPNLGSHHLGILLLNTDHCNDRIALIKNETDKIIGGRLVPDDDLVPIARWAGARPVSGRAFGDYFGQLVLRNGCDEFVDLRRGKLGSERFEVCPGIFA